MFQFRRFPSMRYGFAHGCIRASYAGFPIRISPDRWICAPPRSFSQLVTSFIGSWCQGIRPVPCVLDLSASATSVWLCVSSSYCLFAECSSTPVQLDVFFLIHYSVVRVQQGLTPVLYIKAFRVRLLAFTLPALIPKGAGSHLLSHIVSNAVPSAA